MRARSRRGTSSGAREVGHSERMARAIEMFFDERVDAVVRRLWRRLTDSGLSSLETYGHGRHRPHVSLTVASHWDVDRSADVLAEVGAAAKSGQRPRLDFHALGSFAGKGGILFLSPVATSPLLALHEQVGDILRRHGIVEWWSHYRPGAWVPHCTPAVDLAPADLSSAVGLLSGFQPFRAQVVEIGVTDTTTGTVLSLG